MIYGNGLIASSFVKYFTNNDSYSIFAAGVSNSAEKNNEAFMREKISLLKCIEENRFLVYFSTCSLNDITLLDTPYVRHKLEMESICASASRYLIFRLPQVVGNTANPHTLTNYFYNSIAGNRKFKVWRNASRVLIDVDDVASIVTYLLGESVPSGSTINIAHPYALPALEIVEIFQSILGIKANFELIDEGSVYAIDCSLATDVAKVVAINFDRHYTERLIRKYYAQ